MRRQEASARGGKRGLKASDVLSRVQELLSLGEPLASIRTASITRMVC